MASKNLRKSYSGRTTDLTGEHNRKNEPARTLTPKRALARNTAAGGSGRTFYASGSGQLETVLISGNRVDPAFSPPAALFADEWWIRKTGSNLAMRRVDGQGPGKAVHGCSIM